MSMAEAQLAGNLWSELVENVTLGEKSNRTLEVRAPFPGARLVRIPAAGERDVEFAVRKARSAQVAWESTAIRERCKSFLSFHDALLDRQREVLDIIQLETGKSRRYAVE